MKRVGNFLKSLSFHPLASIAVSLSLMLSVCPVIATGVQASTYQDNFIKVEYKIGLPESSSPSATVRVDPDEDTELTSPDEKIKLKIPKGAVSSTTRIEFSELMPIGSSGMQMLNLFELNAFETESNDKVSEFRKNLEISIQHDPEELKGLDVDSLRLYYYDEKTFQWVPVPDSKYDKEKNVLTATITHFSHYGEQANPLQVGPGRVMATQVNLHSGTATYSYPLEMPPGPGGFQPSLSLTHNSGSVDEMKNKQSVGSWVGIGWSLHLGRISCDLENDEYSLDLNGASYKLVSNDDVNYHTNPDQYFKITRGGNTWEVWDKEGTYYKFGGTTDSEQYCGNEYFRWDLSLIEDTNGNQATVSYVQDIKGYGSSGWVRSAYPEYFTYGNVEVHFTSSWDENDPYDGILRDDNPKSYFIYPEYPVSSAPKIMENKWLESIEIEVDDTLIRQYDFIYNTTDRVFSVDYGGIYYSGEHTLTSITQVGADGTSDLPPITFDYDDLQTYRHTDEGDYSGNPGNPASFTWPHLTAVNSGYGGTISISYTQIPGSSVDNIWTREVVTTKTIDGGIGTDQDYSYAYTGNPQYKGTGWDQEFRGFGEVKETDAAGNYTMHWFYTRGTIGGKDADKLTGNEYETRWYNGSDTLLLAKEYVWDWKKTLSYTSCDYITQFSSWGSGLTDHLFNPTSIDISNDGYVYVAESSGSYGGLYRVIVFDSDGSYVTQFSSWGTGLTDHLFNPTGIDISNDGYVYVTESSGSYGGLYRVIVFDSDGDYITQFSSWGTGQTEHLFNPTGIAVSNEGYVYVTESSYSCGGLYRVIVFDSDGDYITQFSSWGTGQTEHLFNPTGIAVSNEGYVYVTESSYSCGGLYRVIVFDADGDYITQFSSWGTGQTEHLFNPNDTAVSNEGYAYVTESSGSCGGLYRVIVFTGIYECAAAEIHLDQVTETIGNKTTRTRYEYDDYGNVVTEHLDGDVDDPDDNATILRTFYPNTTDNILSKIAKEQVLDSEENAVKEAVYYYDNEEDQYHDDTNWQIPPVKGNLTRLEQRQDESSTISNYYTYDVCGNMKTSTDPNGNTSTWTYETTYNTYPATKTYPAVDQQDPLTESYTYEWNWEEGEDDSGTLKLTTSDANGNDTISYYDTFNNLSRVLRGGDTYENPSIEYQYDYDNWGTLGDQHIKTLIRVDEGVYVWQSQYFDGLGRVVQIHSNGEAGHTIISSTTVFNNRGLTDRQYVSQDLASSQVDGYYAPEAGWKYSSYVYDGLGRVIVQNNADGTSVSTDYSIPWQTTVTNARGFITRYYYDAFGRLTEVEEYDYDEQSQQHVLYATTVYEYDILGNLTRVLDDNNYDNPSYPTYATTMTYDWLGRKTSMTDPDMGTWSYGYDNNGNLISQTDAKGQTIRFDYDELNRFKEKNYPQGSGMTDVVYTYDSGANGKGMRTGMTDAVGSMSYTYDNWGRLVTETRTYDSVPYETSYTYYDNGTLKTIEYPTGDTVTNEYNGCWLPYSVFSSVENNYLVTSTLYNQLGQIAEINLGNGLSTTYGYWDVGGEYDTTGGYYGRLWEIITYESDPEEDAIQRMRYTWDAGGNLTQRENVLTEETETFGYDSLDRLTEASLTDVYDLTYAYDEIGNITSVTNNLLSETDSYDYGSQPHAVTDVGETEYGYDDNGNMTTRGDQTIEWDAENRPVSVSDGVDTSTFVYDGDGNRALKTEGGDTILYINQYYEKNLTTGEVTSSYYLGGKLVATKTGDTLEYIHQDHLSGTALVSDSSGGLVNEISYYPYGSTRSGDVPTDRKFTGQRLDSSGLYYYGARYYDPLIGRFISADTIVQSFSNPQTLNRYSYCLNNPLKYIDPTGHVVDFVVDGLSISFFADVMIGDPGFLDSQIWGDFAELLTAWDLLSDIEPGVAKIMSDSTAVFKIQYGNLSGDRDVGQSLLSTDGTGGDVILDKGNIDPSRGGARAVAVAIAHESIHCVAYALAIANGLVPNAEATQYEEIIAFQFQYSVTKELGYSPGPGWHIGEYFNPTPMQGAYNLSKRAMGVDLSIDYNKSLTDYKKLQRRMDSAFRYESRYRKLPSFPRSTYSGIMESIINQFL
jgi:RHS repeat-associated protein